MTVTETGIAMHHPDILSGLKEKAQQVIEEARRQGADQAEVGISAGEGFSVTVRQGEVETLEFHRDRGIAVSVYLGQCKGSASSTDDSTDSIRETLAAALAIARQTQPDSHAGLAPTEWLATDIPNLELCHPWSITPEQAIEQATACEAAGQIDPRIVNSEGGSVTTGVNLRVYANSQGFLAGYPSSRHSRSCVLVAEQDGVMQRDYWYDSRRRADWLEAVENIGRKAAERTLARLGAQRPPTGNYPVIFAPEVASSLLNHFTAAINGNALYRKASFLCDALGKPLFPEWVTLAEHPHVPAQSASAPFDRDGLPTREQAFIRQGRLESYALGLYAARRLSMDPTGNGGGVRNLTITTGDKNQQQLLAEMDTGVLITEVMGQGVNLVTGDYSRGASGFWVEGGEIRYPIEEFTIAGHLGEMFASLAASGNDVDTRGSIHCGSLLLPQMKIAGL